MQFYYSHTSPFARKVHMLLHFTGLIDRCEFVLTSFESEEFRECNPLGKIPALKIDDLVLFESDLICEYLDDLWCSEGHLSLLCRGSQSYYLQRKAAAQANGVLEAAVNAMFERLRETEQSEYWLTRWKTAIKQSLETIELNNCGLADKPIATSFSLAAALGYLDFRHPQLDWRSWRSDLAQWHQDVAETHWYVKTAPPQT